MVDCKHIHLKLFGTSPEYNLDIKQLGAWCEDCGMLRIGNNWFTPKIHNTLIFPGWTCTRCGVFNGETKETRDECRSCGLSKEAIHG